MKKILKLASVSLLSASILAACGGGNDNGDDNGNTNDGGADNGGDTQEETIGEGDIQLTFWEFGNTGYDALIEEYVEENPNVSINLINGDMNDIHDNLFTSISAGTGAPDIAIVEEAQIGRYLNAQDSFVNLY